MNLIFHDLISRTVEVYIDDVVVKSPSRADHPGHLRQAFARMRAHGLKMNPKKCAFGAEHQAALDDIKKYLSQPPVLMPRKRGKPLRLYISASESSIGCLLAQNNESEREQAKLCLALYFATTKLRHYMLPSVVQIISRTDLIKYMLTRSIIRSRIGKWMMALSEFTFQYVAQKSVKGKALADFLAHHPAQGQEEELEVEIDMAHMKKNYWTMYFDGSSTEARSGAGVVIESAQGQRWQFAFQLDFRCTNNQAEYEALIIGLEILREMKATRVLVYGDSQLVINQLTGDYQCASENLTIAPSLLSPHSPHISYDRRSSSNAPEHRPKSTTYTTTKRPCSSGREPDGRDKFLSRPQSFD
ncbi:unnamed protein product [Prunus brigantina]